MPDKPIATAKKLSPKAQAQRIAELKAIKLILAERARHIEEGYTPAHDDEHDMGELGLAAALYALPYDTKINGEPFLKQDDFIGLHIALETGLNFYVQPEPDKLRRLVKAGSLIVAEIERVLRSEESNG